MSDLTIVAANVVAGAGASIHNGIALSTIVAGQSVYRDPVTLQFAPALANSGTAAIRTPYGIALNSAAANQPVSVLAGGKYNPGATVVPGQIYVLSGANAGGIAPVGDLATGWYTTIIGIADATNDIVVGILSGGVAHA